MRVYRYSDIYHVVFNVGCVVEGRSSILCYTFYYVGYCLHCEINDVPNKLNLGTPQRKRGALT